MERQQKAAILRDLEKKMVFLAGPKQTGRTSLSKAIANEFTGSIYLNYSDIADRKVMEERKWKPSVELVVLDEVHKMPQWKNFLKSLNETPQKFLVIIGAAADLSSFNSFAALHRLMPLSPAECTHVGVPYSIERFLQRGSFPEPFLTESDLDAERWRLQYVDSLIREDVLDFENIHNLKAIQHIFEMLRRRVGSPISYKSIAEDLQIAPNTVKKYIQILEALYIVFRVSPFSKNIARSLLREPKIYFFDTGLVKGNEGVKFENLVGSCLLKHVYAKIDYEAKPYELKYLHTKEGHEVDFALICDEQIESIIEVKNSNHTIGKGLRYFKNKYKLPSYQVVHELRHERIQEGIEVIHGERFLKNLSL